MFQFFPGILRMLIGDWATLRERRQLGSDGSEGWKVQ